MEGETKLSEVRGRSSTIAAASALLKPITAMSSYNYINIEGDGDGEIGYKVLKPGSKGRFTVATFRGDQREGVGRFVPDGNAVFNFIAVDIIPAMR